MVPEKKRRRQDRADLCHEVLLVAEDAADVDYTPATPQGGKQSRGGGRRVKGQARTPLADKSAAAGKVRSTSPSILMVTQLIMALNFPRPTHPFSQISQL